MSKKISYYTKEGLDKLTNELAFLKTKGRSDIAKQIAEARKVRTESTGQPRVAVRAIEPAHGLARQQEVLEHSLFH